MNDTNTKSTKSEKEFVEQDVREILDSLIRAHSLRFTYIRPIVADRASNYGGCTIAWTWNDNMKFDRMLRISISWCHPREQFCGLSGRFLSASAFSRDESILIRLPQVPAKLSVSQQLKVMFEPCVL